MAQQSYERLLSIDPLDCSVWCNLGNALLAARKPEAAISHYNRSIELCPENAIGYYNLSRMQLMEYMFPESNKSFNTAKELDPDSVNRFLQMYSEHPNRVVVDRTFSARDFWRQTFLPTEEKEAFDAYLWERFFAGIPYKYRHAVSCLCLFFVALLLTDRSRDADR